MRKFSATSANLSNPGGPEKEEEPLEATSRLKTACVGDAYFQNKGGSPPHKNGPGFVLRALTLGRSPA